MLSRIFIPIYGKNNGFQLQMCFVIFATFTWFANK